MSPQSRRRCLRGLALAVPLAVAGCAEQQGTGDIEDRTAWPPEGEIGAIVDNRDTENEYYVEMLVRGDDELLYERTADLAPGATDDGTFEDPGSDVALSVELIVEEEAEVTDEISGDDRRNLASVTAFIESGGDLGIATQTTDESDE